MRRKKPEVIEIVRDSRGNWVDKRRVRGRPSHNRVRNFIIAKALVGLHRQATGCSVGEAIDHVAKALSLNPDTLQDVMDGHYGPLYRYRKKRGW
jgi:hypothetical protein